MMMMKKFPEVGEFVVGTVKTVNPNSAFIKLENYDLEGMVHISEISSSWIRDIRRHVKKGQLVVAKVIRVDPSRGFVGLSLKRVAPNQKKDVLQSYKLEKRSKNFLSFIAKSMKLSEDEVEKKVGKPLRDEFGSVYAGFEVALVEPERIKSLLPKYADIITKVAKKNIKIKEFTMKLRIRLSSNAGDGIDRIKKALEKTKLDVSYVSAPEYVLSLKTKDPKRGERVLHEEAEKIIAEMKSFGGEGSIVE